MSGDGKWLKLSLSCPEQMADAVSDLIGVLSGAGVEQSPARDGSVTISGFFQLTEGLEARAIVRALRRELEQLFALYGRPLGEIAEEQFADADWATSWQQYFKPFVLAPGLIVKPSWEEYTAATGERIIELDPGMAFGTGQHESTRLATGLIAGYCRDQAPARVLDVGTGTGILAMAAVLFGAGQVLAMDNDPVAVTVAGENVARNGLEKQITLSGADLATLTGPYDLICANIVHDVLADMAPDFRRLLVPGGALVLAGILLGGQQDNLTRLFTGLGMTPRQAAHEGDWAALLFQG